MENEVKILCHPTATGRRNGVSFAAIGGRDGAELIGVVSIEDTDSEDPWVSGLHVTAEYRHFGIGRALVAACIAAARERACPRLALWVNADNASAIRIYTAAGFVIAQKPKTGDMMMVRQMDAADSPARQIPQL